MHLQEIPGEEGIEQMAPTTANTELGLWGFNEKQET